MTKRKGKINTTQHRRETSQCGAVCAVKSERGKAEREWRKLKVSRRNARKKKRKETKGDQEQ